MKCCFCELCSWGSTFWRAALGWSLEISGSDSPPTVGCGSLLRHTIRNSGGISCRPFLVCRKIGLGIGILGAEVSWGDAKSCNSRSFPNSEFHISLHLFMRPR
eukprot:8937531-Pyramimonas_sp.AAC.1